MLHDKDAQGNRNHKGGIEIHSGSYIKSPAEDSRLQEYQAQGCKDTT